MNLSPGPDAPGACRGPGREGVPPAAGEAHVGQRGGVRGHCQGLPEERDHRGGVPRPQVLPAPAVEIRQIMESGALGEVVVIINHTECQ